MINNNYALPEVKGSYRFNADLSKTSWFAVGGAAEILFRPQDSRDLAYFLKNRPSDLAITILGACSNVIIRDGGIAGIVVKLGREFAQISHYDNVLEVGAGCLCTNAALYCKMNGLGGVEFLSGIPGAIGGAVAMNAGCYGSDVASTLISATAIDYSGNIVELNVADMDFSYRKNAVSANYIFTSARFRFTPSSSAEVAERIAELSRQREQSQPIRSKTGGSTFKNPSGQSAWKLIDAAGCRGMVVGDAQISEKHCNFMINRGKASAIDLIDLGNKVIDLVFQKTGILLEWEIKIIGRNK